MEYHRKEIFFPDEKIFSNQTQKKFMNISHIPKKL